MKAFVSVSATPPVTAAKPAPTTALTAVGRPPVAAPGAQQQPVAAYQQ